MKVAIDYTPEEAAQFPHLEESGKTIGELVQNALDAKETKEALFRFQWGVFNAHDWSIENLSKYLTDDFIDHAAMPGDLPGLEGVQSRFSAWHAAFNSAMEENDEIVASGDTVGVLYNLRSRHVGDFMGIPPTNEELVIPGIEFVRVRDGKIAAHWGIYDFMTTAEELNTDLRFVPRESLTDPRRPEVAWSQGLTEESESTE